MSQFLNSKSLCLSVFFSQNEPKICCHWLLSSRHMLTVLRPPDSKRTVSILSRVFNEAPSLQNAEFGRYLTIGVVKKQHFCWTSLL